MFKIEINNSIDENLVYEIYYTNEYQELKSIIGDNRPYYGEWDDIPYGLTVTDVSNQPSNMNGPSGVTCLLKNSFFPIAVKKDLVLKEGFVPHAEIDSSRQIIPLTEDEYWALNEAYYENEPEINVARREIFNNYYSKSVKDSIATNIATDAHVKCKTYF